MRTSQALVDRPDEIRRVINFKRLALTDLKIDIPRLAKKKVLKEALETSGAPITHLRATPGLSIPTPGLRPVSLHMTPSRMCVACQHHKPNTRLAGCTANKLRHLA